MRRDRGRDRAATGDEGGTAGGGVRLQDAGRPLEHGDIPGYQDLVPIGSGGFSTVYRAYQSRFERAVALKVLTIDNVDERSQRRFQRECALMGRLTGHPNIVTVFDSGFSRSGKPYIAMEHLARGSVASQLDRSGPFSMEHVLRLGIKMCGALSTAHQANILHRDIKPQNMLVSAYGQPALADFGISIITSKLVQSATADALTPRYAAPELFQGLPATAATDIYALGCTLYTLLAGRTPFEIDDDDSFLALAMRIMEAPLPRIDRHDVPDVMADLLAATMAKDPAYRFASAAALANALRDVERRLGLPPTEFVHHEPEPAELVANDVIDLRDGAPTPNPVPALPGVSEAIRALPETGHDTPVPPSLVAGPLRAAPAAPVVPTSAPAAPRRRWLLAVAVVAVLALAGAIAFVGRPSPGRPASSSITVTELIPSGANGSDVLVLWTDSDDLTAVTHDVVVTAGPDGTELRRVSTPPGQTSVSLSGLDRTVELCFVVRADAGGTAEPTTSAPGQCLPPVGA